jgi:tRNA 2-thiouridine synthesizing protein A
MKTIAVVLAGSERAEALRAAVGLTLRGDRVTLVGAPPEGRAVATLAAMGHRVDGGLEDIARADVVEVWTSGSGAATPLPASGRWLVRSAAEPRPPGAAVLDDLTPEAALDLILDEPVALWGSAAETLDLCGEVCPFTFVRTKLRLEELPARALLRVLVDHAPASRNIPRSATEWGQRVVGVAAAGAGRWEIWIERAPQ